VWREAFGNTGTAAESASIEAPPETEIVSEFTDDVILTPATSMNIAPSGRKQVLEKAPVIAVDAAIELLLARHGSYGSNFSLEFGSDSAVGDESFRNSTPNSQSLDCAVAVQMSVV
jgi:hypothetical protein